ncbi:Rne/Rng family ribonuclease [Irregularibacter muris]|uniref:Ribonuclease G n=1 Tax=Irregularibacter muris TaxID=1796619 RepID=A0AAE3L4D5_9FIRM|nr:Rne/Rng family ribonuclease [Irregularibacter muris]MCR1899913.1 Rne/Rng family ribonuclease [Irregularibacter muris]
MKRIIVDINHAQSRIALADNEELIEFYIERPKDKRIVGNIYKGKVENVLPGMQAAFINIGIEKNAFLYVKDTLTLLNQQDRDEDELPPINQILKRGQEIMVQVIKEPIDQKGARVSADITIPGRYLVLMPTVDYIGISRRIQDDHERERLKSIAQEIIPSNMGVIIRTEAKDIEKEEFVQDLNFLLKMWEKIDYQYKLVLAPRALHEELELIYRTVRDLFTKEIDEFIINEKDHYKKVLEMVDMISPTLKDKVHYYKEDLDIFSHYHIRSQIDEMLSNKVWLDSGGYIVIDRTEALTVVDVNTGKFVGSINLQDTVLKTNLEAAQEIAKQLRLRNIGGIIIIDFIDMKSPQDEEKVLSKLKDALKKDKTRTNVLGITSLGLVEMTRKKVRKSIGKILQEPCPLCNGTGQVLSIDSILVEIDEFFMRNPHFKEEKTMYLHLNPHIALMLEQEEDHSLEQLENKYHMIFKIVANDALSHDQVRVLKHE